MKTSIKVLFVVMLCFGLKTQSSSATNDTLHCSPYHEGTIICDDGITYFPHSIVGEVHSSPTVLDQRARTIQDMVDAVVEEERRNSSISN